MMKILRIIPIFLAIIMPVTLLAHGKKITKVVVDAGHGGRDYGAMGAFSYEKNVTLAVSLKLGKLISDSLKGVQVIYTRTEDEYPTLPQRHDIANGANADLFIAIHANSTPFTYSHVLKGYKTVGKRKKKVPIYQSIRHHETSRSGVETYVLGLHRLGQQGGEVQDEFTGDSSSVGILDANNPQTAIIVAQYTAAFLNRSVKLGNRIQEQFAAQGRNNLGVKQKGLEVLAGSAMPGVLVEIGFINNNEEEVYLNSEKGQFEVAYAIFSAIRDYKMDVEK